MPINPVEFPLLLLEMCGSRGRNMDFTQWKNTLAIKRYTILTIGQYINIKTQSKSLEM